MTSLCPVSGEKPFLCDKCGRGFNRVDNLRSHVKTVHHGKAGMKRLVVAGGSADEGADGCLGASTSDEINIVTVTTEDIVTLATEALAASAVAQLTGQRASLRLSLVILWGNADVPYKFCIHYHDLVWTIQ